MKKTIIETVTKKELEKLYLIKEENKLTDVLDYIKNKVSDFTKKDDKINPEDENIFTNIGGKLKDTLKNIFTDEESIREISKSKFINQLTSMINSGDTLKYGETGDNVELVQIALQILGFLPEDLGISGIYDRNTEKSVKKFEKSVGSSENGVLDKKDLEYLRSDLILKNFKDSDLSKVQKFSSFSKIEVGSDEDFYKSILKGINAPITEENMKFLYAWRKAEGAKAKNNPFNTTLSLSKDKEKTNYNKVGVKNYSTSYYGIEATIKTLLNGRYDCIVNGLRKDIGALEISECQSLHTWGTGDLVNQVLTMSKGNIKPPRIY